MRWSGKQKHWPQMRELASSSLAPCHGDVEFRSEGRGRLELPAASQPAWPEKQRGWHFTPHRGSCWSKERQDKGTWRGKLRTEPHLNLQVIYKDIQELKTSCCCRQWKGKRWLWLAANIEWVIFTQKKLLRILDTYIGIWSSFQEKQLRAVESMESKPWSLMARKQGTAFPGRAHWSFIQCALPVFWATLFLLSLRSNNKEGLSF